eukprot:GAHX01000512.1.p1 GENE.GAHX01000512.1~~GAHX01000512.1.p1  ORF type:complete len:342 (+),score=87.12 GAHX01000512.1:47-1027(+)
MESAKNVSPELFFDEDKAKQYSSSLGVKSFQMTSIARSLSLLNLPEGSLVLDLGSGSGVSMCSIEEFNHLSIGMDISMPMLEYSRTLSTKNQHSKTFEDVQEAIGNFQLKEKPLSIKQEFEKITKKVGDELHADFSYKIPLRPNIVDGAVGICSVEWLLKATSSKENILYKLKCFFKELARVLKYGSKAVFVVSGGKAEKHKVAEILLKEASKAGFIGGLVIDFPNSRKKKTIYMTLGNGYAEFERNYEERYKDKVTEERKEKYEVGKMSKKQKRKYLKQKEKEMKNKEENSENKFNGKNKSKKEKGTNNIKSRSKRKSKYKEKLF